MNLSVAVTAVGIVVFAPISFSSDHDFDAKMYRQWIKLLITLHMDISIVIAPRISISIRLISERTDDFDKYRIHFDP